MSEENVSSKQPLIRHVNRQQRSWRAVDVARLIGEDHAARAIWPLVGRLHRSAFYRAIDSHVEEGGRPAFDAQRLIRLWVYAYRQGIGSAREVVLAWRQKMASEKARAPHRRGRPVAEFCHAWIKSKLGLRQLHVRGMVQVATEVLWACLTYNLQHGIRRRKLPAAPASG